MTKEFHCPFWTASCGECCPHGTINSWCPGHSVDLPKPSLLDRIVNTYAAQLEANIWPVCIVLCVCIMVVGALR